MDLSTLLAREGIEAGELDALVKWARHRATALVARIEPGSPLAEALGASLERARDGNGTPVAHSAPSSGPRPTARAVSKPYLGAAVAAALSGKQEDLDLALETAAADAEADDLDLEMPVLEDSPPAKPTPVAPAPAAAPDPEPELDENDPSIGGYNRFAFSFRRREAERAAAAEESRTQLAFAREAASRVEDPTPATSGEWNVDALELPEPPTFIAKVTRQRQPGTDPGDAEASGLLVLGIPDEEGIDIPVQRQRSSVRYADSRPFESFTPPTSEAFERSEPQRVTREPSRPHSTPEVHEMRPVLDDEDSFDLGLDNLEADAPDPHAAQHDDSGPQHPHHPHHPHHPDHADSGAHASGPRWEGPQHVPPPPPPTPGTGPNKTLSVRSVPPPPPPREAKARGRGKPPPAPASGPAKAIVVTKKTGPNAVVGGREKTGANEAVGADKRGAKRKKVVELSQPVVRPGSGPMDGAGPSTGPSERSGQRPIPADDEVLVNPRHASVPDYLRDDDE